jgi:hypothetical protein
MPTRNPQERAVKGLTILSTAKHKQPGVKFELERRKRGRVTSAMMFDLRQAAGKGDESAIKSLESYTGAPRKLFTNKQINGRSRGPKG